MQSSRGLSTVQSKDQRELSKLSADEYLEKTGLAKLLSDALLDVTQTRPIMALEYMDDVFSMKDRTPLRKSFYNIRSCSISQSNFMDIVLKSFKYLKVEESKDENGYISVTNCNKLISLLCVDFPMSHLKLFTTVLEDINSCLNCYSIHSICQRTEDNESLEFISFETFSIAVQSCFLYSDYLDFLNQFFLLVDPKNEGIAVSTLYDQLEVKREMFTQVFNEQDMLMLQNILMKTLKKLSVNEKTNSKELSKCIIEVLLKTKTKTLEY